MHADDDRRRRMLELIRSNIAGWGYHVNLIPGGHAPRFAYTVGLTEAGRPELLLPGAASLSAKQVKRVIDATVTALAQEDASAKDVEVDGLGAFRTTPAHPSWARRTLLAAFDYYDRDDVGALQISPVDGDLLTIDVPNAARPFDSAREGVWQWLDGAWPFDIPPESMTVTNLDALRGHMVTEASRWEETEWEIFSGAGPEVAPEDARVVPLSTLLGFDPSIEPVIRLAIGSGLWRDPPGPWNAWERRA